jgi:hypothetical protein
MRWLCLAAVLVVCASCSKKAEGAAEVEILGTVTGPVKAARFRAFVTREPCDMNRTAVTALGKADLVPETSKTFFIEIFVPQNSTGHLCVLALDGRGQEIGFGAARENPMTFAGKGEVTFRPTVNVEAVSPRAAPAGL